MPCAGECTTLRSALERFVGGGGRRDRVPARLPPDGIDREAALLIVGIMIAALTMMDALLRLTVGARVLEALR